MVDLACGFGRDNRLQPDGIVIIDLNERHALITGGGTGIGGETAMALADAGARVTICSRNPDNLANLASHRSIVPVVMDVTSEESVVQATSEAVRLNGRIDIHVANAGIARGCMFEDMDLDFWNRTLAVNLTGAYLSIRESLKSMREGNWGRIVAIASVAGIRGLKGATAYTVSKHGMVGLVRGLSEELMHHPITVNAICPGYVDTPILDRSVVSMASQRAITTAEATAKLAKLNRHKRILSTREVTSAIVWLCSENTGSINGQVIPITGGQV